LGRKQNVGELLARLERASPREERVSERRRAERREARIVRVKPEVPAPTAPDPVPAPPPNDGALARRLADLLVTGPAGGARTVDLASSLDVDASEVRDELLVLERLGVVFRTGRTRATRWFLG
jgi:hypothetical protein